MADTSALIAFMDRLKAAVEPDEARAIADETFFRGDAASRNERIAMGTSVNPFFAPHFNDAAQATKMFGAEAWLKSVAMARAVAANTRQPRLLVTAAPKSGSTFLSYRLRETFGVPLVGLMITSAYAYAHSMLGAHAREHDVDEMALLTAVSSQPGFLAHRHIIATPFLANQLKLYNVDVIVTYRNIFDSMVSYDEFFQKGARENPAMLVQYGMPADWLTQDFDDRLEILLDRWLDWFMRFFVSWLEVERAGVIRPIRVSYDRYFGADSRPLAELLGERLGREADIEPLVAALSAKQSGALNVNVGVKGRGDKISGRNRARIVDHLHRYRSMADFSELLGDAG